jgi:hypothetical protein
MFDCICDVSNVAVDTRLFQTVIEKMACRPDKGSSLKILLISRLFSNKHDRRRPSALTEDGLSRFQIKITALTVSGGFAQ